MTFRPVSKKAWKANAIREAIYEEHRDVVEDAYANAAGNLILIPNVVEVLSGVLAGVSASKAAAKYIEAETAAGQRMEQILAYKERDSCPSGPTASPDLTDSVILMQLRKLKRQLDQQEIEQKQYILDRRKLLDDLR